MTTENTTNFAANKSPEFMRETYYSNRQSREDEQIVCRKYNCSDKSQAIRLALRFLAENELARVPPPETPAPKRGRPRMEK